MARGSGGDPGGSAGRRYGRETIEFARVANLSDAVFAIAMTLLVLTLDVPAVPAGGPGPALVDVLPQLLVVALGFTLVANIWWAHHRLFARLAVIEPGTMAINLVLLGAVALFPFPTGLIGAAPTSAAAVVPFVGLVVVLNAVFMGLTVRAHRADAWRWPIPRGIYRWMLIGWTAHVLAMVAALLLALWIPVVGLVAVALGGTAVGLTLSVLAPEAYGDWA